MALAKTGANEDVPAGNFCLVPTIKVRATVGGGRKVRAAADNVKRIKWENKNGRPSRVLTGVRAATTCKLGNKNAKCAFQNTCTRISHSIYNIYVYIIAIASYYIVLVWSGLVWLGRHHACIQLMFTKAKQIVCTYLSVLYVQYSFVVVIFHKSKIRE